MLMVVTGWVLLSSFFAISVPVGTLEAPIKNALCERRIVEISDFNGERFFPTQIEKKLNPFGQFNLQMKMLDSPTGQGILDVRLLKGSQSRYRPARVEIPDEQVLEIDYVARWEKVPGSGILLMNHLYEQYPSLPSVGQMASKNEERLDQALQKIYLNNFDLSRASHLLTSSVPFLRGPPRDFSIFRDDKSFVTQYRMILTYPTENEHGTWLNFHRSFEWQ